MITGVVAQLGERVVRNDKVRGSIPLHSTCSSTQSRSSSMNLFKSFRNLAIIALLLSPLSLHAQDGKIAIVNLQYALNNTAAGKQAKTALESEGEQKKKQLELLESDLKKMQEEIQKQKLVLSESALQEKTNTLRQKYGELQQKAIDFEKELKRKESENIEKILVGLREVVSSIASKSGYLYVLENSQGTVVYTDPNAVTDITDEVIAAYNSKKK